MALFQPSGLFREIPRSGAGYFALGGKVTKTPPAPFGPATALSNRTPAKEMPGCH